MKWSCDAAAEAYESWARKACGEFDIPHISEAFQAGWAAYSTTDDLHPDDIAVDLFAARMKAKLAKSREKGRGGWDDPAQCSTDYLRQLLHDHVVKGDPVDVANFCMMLAHYGATTTPPDRFGEGYRAGVEAAGKELDDRATRARMAAIGGGMDPSDASLLDYEYSNAAKVIRALQPEQSA